MTTADPICPSLVAVMRADPEASADTRPPSETAATDGLSLDQLTPLLSTCPAASCGTASWTPPPTTVCTSERTLTEATGPPPGTASQVPVQSPHDNVPLSLGAGGPVTSAAYVQPWALNVRRVLETWPSATGSDQIDALLSEVIGPLHVPTWITVPSMAGPVWVNW